MVHVSERDPQHPASPDLGELDDLGLVRFHAAGWRCLDCGAEGANGRDEAFGHLCDVHRDDPYVGRCGSCDEPITVGELYCCADHEREDQASMQATTGHQVA